MDGWMDIPYESVPASLFSLPNSVAQYTDTSARDIHTEVERTTDV